jgi:hypothetical protein
MHTRPRRKNIDPGNKRTHTQSCDLLAWNIQKRTTSSSSESDYTNSYLVETRCNSGVNSFIRQEIESNFNKSEVNSSYKFPRFTTELTDCTRSDRYSGSLPGVKTNAGLRFQISHLVKVLSHKRQTSDISSYKSTKNCKEPSLLSTRQPVCLPIKVYPLKISPSKKLLYNSRSKQLSGDFNSLNRTNRSPELRPSASKKDKVFLLSYPGTIPSPIL